jgi:hypothetical protein
MSESDGCDLESARGVLKKLDAPHGEVLSGIGDDRYFRCIDRMRQLGLLEPKTNYKQRRGGPWETLAAYAATEAAKPWILAARDDASWNAAASDLQRLLDSPATDEFGEAARFLEEYSLNPPRAESHHPASETVPWRKIQVTIRDLAGRLRGLSVGTKGVEFLERDAVFLEDQSDRIRRVQTLSEHDRRAAEAAGIAANRFKAIAALVQTRIQFK